MHAYDVLYISICVYMYIYIHIYSTRPTNHCPERDNFVGKRRFRISALFCKAFAFCGDSLVFTEMTIFFTTISTPCLTASLPNMDWQNFRRTTISSCTAQRLVLLVTINRCWTTSGSYCYDVYGLFGTTGQFRASSDRIPHGSARFANSVFSNLRWHAVCWRIWRMSRLIRTPAQHM